MPAKTYKMTKRSAVVALTRCPFCISGPDRTSKSSLRFISLLYPRWRMAVKHSHRALIVMHTTTDRMGFEDLGLLLINEFGVIPEKDDAVERSLGSGDPSHE